MIYTFLMASNPLNFSFMDKQMSIFPCFFIVFLLHSLLSMAAAKPACKTKCGSLDIKYPLGSGHGCGSPRFHPYVACSPDGHQLLLTTHTGSYPITSINYATSSLTITPPCMSNCTFMQPSPNNLGLDWASPFQLGPSTFILLSCSNPSSSLTLKGNPICDPSSIYLCASIYTCPSVVALGLPLFPPTNSCCVYSPANLDEKDDLDLDELKCGGYTSVVTLGEVPTDPLQWEYGVVLKYTLGGLDSYNVAPSCRACEMSGGVCGYAPPRNTYICVCENGFNTTTDCYSYRPDLWISASSTSKTMNSKAWMEFLPVLILFIWTTAL